MPKTSAKPLRYGEFRRGLTWWCRCSALDPFRDWGGWLVDFRTDPVLRHVDSSVGAGLFAWRVVSDRAALLPAQRTLDEAFDEYSLVRAAYIQRRVYEIYDGSPPEEDYLYLDSNP